MSLKTFLLFWVWGRKSLGTTALSESVEEREQRDESSRFLHEKLKIRKVCKIRKEELFDVSGACQKEIVVFKDRSRINIK